MCVRKRTESCLSPAKSPKKLKDRMESSLLPANSPQSLTTETKINHFEPRGSLALARNQPLAESVNLSNAPDFSLMTETTLARSQHSLFNYKPQDHSLKAKTKYDYGDRCVYSEIK